MDSNSYTDNDEREDEWNVPSSSPLASYIQQLPEIVKLILATIFVAVVIHVFLSSRRNSNDDIQILRAELSGGGAVGSSDNMAADEDEIISGGQKLGDDASSRSSPEEFDLANESTTSMEKKKKKKKQLNNVENRNYDALICKKEEEEPAAADEVGVTNNGKAEKSPSNQKDDKADDEDAPTSNHNSDTDTATQEEEEEPADLPPAPVIELKSQTNHPGLHGYYNWLSTITSLYRIYAIPYYENSTISSSSSSSNNNNNYNNATYHQAHLPMHPSSERGNVPLYIEVTNLTSHNTISVYWVDYKGNEIYKGSMSRGGMWTQTTYIGHPWTFRIGTNNNDDDDNGGEENVLLRYAPFRVIPTIVGAETSRVDSNNEGIQKFTLRDVPNQYVLYNSETGRLYTPVVWVEDEMLPEPPLKLYSDINNDNTTSFTTNEMNYAIQWSCQQIQREDAIYQGNGLISSKNLLQYLKNICLNPDAAKYRKLRLGNRIFQSTIYNTGARGVLLALGFEEHYGYLECGPGGEQPMLSSRRIQQISDAMMIVNHTLKMIQDGTSSVVQQPEGGDGYGRAGFGHAGGMNL